MRTVIRGGDLVLPDTVLVCEDLVFAKGRFLSVGGRGTGDEVVDAFGCTVMPGLVDIHVHGAQGCIVGHDPKAVDILSRILPRFGITSFLPTVAAVSDFPTAVAMTREQVLRPALGARALGIHLEGPFLNPSHSGALPADCFAMPTPDAVKSILDAAGSEIRILTLAPELPGALDLVSTLARQGVVPAAGHTAAPFEVMEKARDKGLAHVTHCFNAMRRFSHRNPGPIEAALVLKGLTVEVICDGRHVQAPAVDILLRCRGIDTVCMVSDATGLLLGNGTRLEMAGRTLEVADGAVRDLETKALAGSAESLLFAVTTMRRWFHTSWPDCARLAAANPAGIVGQGARIGSLETGKSADFFLLGPGGEVRATYVAGVKVWP